MDKTQVLSSKDIERAAQLLKSGQLVAFPTETVYGLGACIFNPEAILSIFKAKGRPSDNPLIAHLSSVEQTEEVAQEIPPSFYRLAEHFMPGPLTVVIKKRSHVPSLVSAGLDSIALRIPSHPVAQALIRCVGEPLVAPSANLSGKPSATQAKHVLEDFDGKIAAIIDGGKTNFGLESTVVSLLGDQPVLLRPGAITREQIEEVLQCSITTASHSGKGPALSPGMKYRHYAPAAPVKVFMVLEELLSYLHSPSPSLKRMLLSSFPLDLSHPGLDRFPLEASEFYALLRHADASGYQEILILCDESIQKQAALMNRLLRAAES